MKQIVLTLAIFGFITSCKNYTQETSNSQDVNKNIELEWLEDWLSAWELMSKELLNLPYANPPTMLFYDEKYVYTTSEISAPDGEKFNGPKFFGEELPWKRAVHNDTIVIPDGQKIPIQLMSFAAPSEEENVESFFVMAAPSFWKNKGIESEEVGLKKMLTGVFLHEFAHTRQMKGIGKRISEIEKQYKFKMEVSDDIVQDYFSGDTNYVEKYNKEIELLYKATESGDMNMVKQYTLEGLKLLKERQSGYLLPENKALVELDNAFLSMEGLGQYIIVAWLNHPQGGAVPFDAAVKATGRGHERWSQDEGLALFLILTRISQPDYSEDMFGDNPKNITDLIESELKR